MLIPVLKLSKVILVLLLTTTTLPVLSQETDCDRRECDRYGNPRKEVVNNV